MKDFYFLKYRFPSYRKEPKPWNYEYLDDGEWDVEERLICAGEMMYEIVDKPCNYGEGEPEWVVISFSDMEKNEKKYIIEDIGKSIKYLSKRLERLKSRHKALLEIVDK